MNASASIANTADLSAVTVEDKPEVSILPGALLVSFTQYLRKTMQCIPYTPFSQFLSMIGPVAKI